MGGEAALLDRIDGALAAQDVLAHPDLEDLRALGVSVLDEVEVLIDESMETGIQILPTVVDRRDAMIGALTTQALPAVVRQVGMPLSAIAGQRSIL